jgi:hypothetical protein
LTEDSHANENAESGKKRPEWVEEAEDALERIGNAIAAGWDATRETRMSALDSAKHAAKQLGEAIDQGMGTARQMFHKDEAGSTEEE